MNVIDRFAPQLAAAFPDQWHCEDVARPVVRSDRVLLEGQAWNTILLSALSIETDVLEDTTSVYLPSNRTANVVKKFRLQSEGGRLKPFSQPIW